MNIQQLPVEILMEIFSYLESLGNVSLVNKHFYDVVWKMKDFKFCLTLDDDFFARNKVDGRDSHELLESMMSTNRKISKISMAIENIEQLMFNFVPIIKHLSATIKYAKFIKMPCNMSLEILQLMPALQHLVIEDFQLFDEQETKAPSSNEDLELHQLKKVHITASNENTDQVEYLDKFLIALNRLPAGVLTEISLYMGDDYKSLHKFTELFKRQTNIEKVCITGKIGFRIAYCEVDDLPSDIFDNVKLKSLEFHKVNMGSHSATILSKQTNLKSLALYDISEEAVVNVVVEKLTELETLKMEFHERAIASFAKIGNLTKLKELTLEDSHVTNLVHFTCFEFSKMITLDIYRCKLPSKLVHSLAKSVPNLKVFRIFSLNDYKTFNSIMRFFNFVEVLDVRCFYENFEGDYNLLMGSGCFNSKLIDLNIGCTLPYEIPFLNQLISDHPNLKSFRIHSRTPLTTEHFKLILNGLPKLRTLSFDADDELRDYLQSFRHSKKNLELMY